ncbi:hypothetical protein EHS25_003696 [Saitozyma podzolica]|uniref:NmrA-like domain-containing protein n=1 Tax=Saitozyma podzolica TaxID=1890683 RepID=A0A427Y3A1_9TREE|nr:hypothetical protein EHS25_003696 [Saitozyma podzolica]
MTAKTIFVFTVTGDQGRSVAGILQEAGWEVTGLVRNLESEPAKALAKQGIKLVQGDLNHPESYTKHLEGHYAAFVNANFFSAFETPGMTIDKAMEIEIQQSITAVEACAKAGVKHIIYSTLEDFGGDKVVPFFTTKAKVTQHILEKSLPVTNIRTSTYYSNVLKFQQLKPNPKTGGYFLVMQLPDDSQLTYFDVERLGDWVLAVLNDPAKYIRKDIDACSEYLTPVDIANTLSRATGKPFETLHITKDEFYTDKNKAEASLMWPFFRAGYEGYLKRDIAASRAVNPKQGTFAEWAAASKDLKAAIEGKAD